MPRGMRALHAVGGFEHEGSVETFERLLLEQELVTACWCGHGFVMVTQRDVRWGRTGSCGFCRPPAAHTAEMSVAVFMSGSNWKLMTEEQHGRLERRIQRINAQPAQRDAVVKRRHKGRPASPHVAARRERVRQLYINLGGCRGATQIIADRLRATKATISMDLHVLRETGALPRRELPA